MTRSTTTRTTISTRDTNHPQTYIIDVYGDSFSDNGGGTGWIGETLNRCTSEKFIYREQATGGDTVSEIRTAFEAHFPAADGNFVVLQGAINSIRTDVALSSIKTDYIAMINAVESNGNFGLAVLGQSPWMGHAQWTTARQTVTEHFNSWLATTYPDYYVNVYDALGDPSEPRQLADECYKSDRTDAHPSRNANVIDDDLIGELFFYRTPTISRTDIDSGNIFTYPNTPASWANNLRATIGGNSITMCDGTISSINGVIPSTDSITHIARDSLGAQTASQTITFKALVKPGQHRWVRLEYKDNAGSLNRQDYDMFDGVLGVSNGTVNSPTITKAARGWWEISFVGDTGVGATSNTLTIFPAESDGDINFTGDARTPSCYVDRVQAIL